MGYEESDKLLFPYYLCALFANILIAYIKIFIKNISKRESNTKIQFYFSLNSTIILLKIYIYRITDFESKFIAQSPQKWIAKQSI